MRILYLTLHKYLRLSLSNIETFEIDCANPEQIIIGTNGSGKSSIMQELTPVPAHRRNFTKGGYKLIYIRHNHKLYKLFSDFKSGNNHEFWVAEDDTDYLAANYENLNPGRTYKVQLSLVEEHFGIIPDLIDLFVSKEKFTSMSVSRRKEWIIRLFGDDLDFVIDLHRKWVQRGNESKTIVNHLRKRVAEESIKLISPEELDQLNSLSQQYQDQLTKLYNSGIERTNFDLDELNKRFQKRLDTILSFTKNVKGNKLIIPKIEGKNLKDIEELKQWVHTLRNRDNEYRTKLNSLHQESSQLSTMIRNLAASNTIEVDVVINDIVTLEANIETLLSKMTYGFFPEVNPTQAKALYDKLIDLSMVMLDNSKRQYTREIANEAKIGRQKLVDEYIVTQRDYDKWMHKLEHIKTAKHEQCPNCDHRWYPGIEVGSKELAEEHITKHAARLNDLDRMMFEADEYLGLYTEFANTANALNALMQSNPTYQAFWDKLLEQDVWYMHPTSISNAINQWSNDVQQSSDILEMQKTIAIKRDIVAEHERNKGNNINQSQGMLAKLEFELNEIHQLISTNSKLIDQLTTFESHYETVRLNYQYAVKEAQVLSKDVATYLEQVATNLVKEQVNDYQAKLANTNSALQSALSIQAIINSLEQNLSQSLQQLEVRDNIAKALDPKTGLIADTIRCFIDLFVEQMNDIIAKVWTIPMEIMSCGFNEDGKDAGDLNYRFPVSHNGGMTLSPDIADNSSAQKDMIDFAFILTVYLYLGLEQYPLYIDELAPTMDELHRININNFVKMLVESNRHSQMFMISHYMSGYGIFQNADICMLSDINIVNKPERYNTHVIIK